MSRIKAIWKAMKGELHVLEEGAAGANKADKAADAGRAATGRVEPHLPPETGTAAHAAGGKAPAGSPDPHAAGTARTNPADNSITPSPEEIARMQIKKTHDARQVPAEAPRPVQQGPMYPPTTAGVALMQGIGSVARSAWASLPTSLKKGLGALGLVTAGGYVGFVDANFITKEKDGGLYGIARYAASGASLEQTDARIAEAGRDKRKALTEEAAANTAQQQADVALAAQRSVLDAAKRDRSRTVEDYEAAARGSLNRADAQQRLNQLGGSMGILNQNQIDAIAKSMAEASGGAPTLNKDAQRKVEATVDAQTASMAPDEKATVKKYLLAPAGP